MPAARPGQPLLGIMRAALGRAKTSARTPTADGEARGSHGWIRRPWEIERHNARASGSSARHRAGARLAPFSTLTSLSLFLSSPAPVLWTFTRAALLAGDTDRRRIVSEAAAMNCDLREVAVAAPGGLP